MSTPLNSPVGAVSGPTTFTDRDAYPYISHPLSDDYEPAWAKPGVISQTEDEFSIFSPPEKSTWERNEHEMSLASTVGYQEAGHQDSGLKGEVLGVPVGVNDEPSIEPVHPPKHRRLERIIVYLVLFIYYSGCGALCAWFNWLVGREAGKWWLSFVIAFAVVPFLFFIPVIPIMCKKKTKRHIEAFIFLFIWGLLVSIGIGFPIAITGHRMKVASDRGDIQAPTTVNANCWQNQQQVPADDWNNKVEYIRWSDADWFVDTAYLKYKVYNMKKLGATYTMCAAPIRLRPESILRRNCSDFPAVAICIEQSYTECNEYSFDLCMWDMRNPGVSRVIRPSSFYKYTGEENSKFNKQMFEGSRALAELTMAAVGNSTNGYEVMPVQWVAEVDMFFFMEKIDALDNCIYIQFICYICTWMGTCLIGFLVTAVRTHRD